MVAGDEGPLASRLSRALAENAALLEKVRQQKELLSQFVPPPVVAELIERQQACGGSPVSSNSFSNVSQACFSRREAAIDAPEIGMAKAVCYDCVTVFFSDIVGFTGMSQQCAPLAVMSFLDTLYSAFDDLLAEKHPTLWKVETIGDSYMIAGGLMEIKGVEQTSADVARSVVAFAIEAMRIAGELIMPNGQRCQIRIGIHSGPTCTGVIGSKMPRYCLFGDTVNTASRMESTGLPGAIQVSAATWDLLIGEQLGAPSLLTSPHSPPLEMEDCSQACRQRHELRWRASGGVNVKGKGLMCTYILGPSVVRRRSAALPTLALAAVVGVASCACILVASRSRGFLRG